MNRDTLGHIRSSASLLHNILIPKYYDPSVDDDLRVLSKSHERFTLGNLIDAGHVAAQSGNDIGKMTYGTGRVPFVRTTDLADWELAADPRQGVSQAVHSTFAPRRQDVEAGDILFVKDGLLLIGNAAMVTPSDLPLLYQSHLLRLRVTSNSPVSSGALLAALSSPLVRRQVKAKQFSAGIIDKIEKRYRELVLPLPKSDFGRHLGKEVVRTTYRRAELRDLLGTIPYRLENHASGVPAVGQLEEDDKVRDARLGFLNKYSSLGNIFIPKYHDPGSSRRLDELRGSHKLVRIGELVEDRLLTIEAGVEVGKMAYGTGSVPFVRTSDMSNWELKGTPKHTVARQYLEAWSYRVNTRPGDILLVRNGTSLVGTSAIIGDDDDEVMYSDGVYRLRVDPERLDPYLLIALLNTPVARRQMRAKQFTRDIIDTIGRRLLEVVLPFPRDRRFGEQMASLVRDTVRERSMLRNRALAIAREITGEA